LSGKDLSTYGFLGYPILQAADILLYRATHVPVGADQLPHVEMTREIARRFNNFYPAAALPEPESVLTPSPRVPGTDGRKMSKSYGNAVFLSDPAAEVDRKVMSMYTDPQKLRKDTPGQPDNCVVLALFKIYRSDLAPEVERECRAGERGCVNCKKQLLPFLHAVLDPIRARREQLAAAPGELEAILYAGAQAARKRAQETLAKIRTALGWRKPPDQKLGA
jgi:tryptophanyl-tRNA synthetase